MDSDWLTVMVMTPASFSSVRHSIQSGAVQPVQVASRVRCHMPKMAPKVAAAPRVAAPRPTPDQLREAGLMASAKPATRKPERPMLDDAHASAPTVSLNR